MCEEGHEEHTEELSEMPIWKDHEQRITTLEVQTAEMKSEFREVKEKIDDGNASQSEKLQRIDDRLMDEFFKKQQEAERSRNKKEEISQKYKWKFATKVIAALVGGGSILYVILENFLGGF